MCNFASGQRKTQPYDIFKETFRIDITQFWKKTRILTLKDDNVIIECLDIDKKDDTVFQIVT